MTGLFLFYNNEILQLKFRELAYFYNPGNCPNQKSFICLSEIQKILYCFPSENVYS